MSRYSIWNKQVDVYTPSGAKFTAKQWIEKYPIAAVSNVKVVCAGGTLNGAFFGIFSDMVDMYKKAGCDFSNCVIDQDYLDKIEEFEDNANAPSNEVSTDERTAAALEFIAMNSLPDAQAE